MPRKYLQRPRMDDLAAGSREKLGERGRTLMGRASRPALVNQVARAQIRLLVELLLDRPVLARVLLGVRTLALAGAAGGGRSVSTEPQTSATRCCCDCDARQNQTRERGRRV